MQQCYSRVCYKILATASGHEILSHSKVKWFPVIFQITFLSSSLFHNNCLVTNTFEKSVYHKHQDYLYHTLSTATCICSLKGSSWSAPAVVQYQPLYNFAFSQFRIFLYFEHIKKYYHKPEQRDIQNWTLKLSHTNTLGISKWSNHSAA